MRALVIFGSAFGNTQEIAQAIAEGLSAHMLVDVAEAGVAPDDLGHQLDLLVVGGPTQGFSMSRPGPGHRQRSRRVGLVSPGIGLREWLARAQGVSFGAAAAFDTRFKKPRWLTGSAPAPPRSASAKSGTASRRRQRASSWRGPRDRWWTGSWIVLADGATGWVRRSRH